MHQTREAPKSDKTNFEFLLLNFELHTCARSVQQLLTNHLTTNDYVEKNFLRKVRKT